MRDIIAALVTCLTLGACSAPVTDHQEQDIEEPAPIKTELNDIQAGLRSSLLDAAALYEEASPQDGLKGYYAQLLGLAGREDIPYRDGVTGQRTQSCVPFDADPVDTIIEAAKTHSLIIINEDHTMPRDRAFIHDLLKALHKEGFTHYAAETFYHGISRTDPPFASADDGYYSNDPIYGRLLDYAKQAGFELVAYEQTDDQRAPEGSDIETQIVTRETAQTENLIAAVLGQAPDTKILIHVGHSHVAEIPLPTSGGGSLSWMAARLKEATGINPLTIGQAVCRSQGPRVEIGTNRLNKDGTDAMVFTDLIMGHPEVSFTRNRPDWRRRSGDIDTPIPSMFVGQDEIVLVEARSVGRPDLAVPTDRVLLLPGETDIPLLLPPGTYRIDGFTKNGPVSGPVEISVEAR